MAQLILKREEQSLKKPLRQSEVDGRRALTEEGIGQPQDLVLHLHPRLRQEDHRRAQEKSVNQLEENTKTIIIDSGEGREDRVAE